MATSTAPRVGTIHYYVESNFKLNTNDARTFQCIMIYQDEETKFIFVKPLLWKGHLETALELFKIFTSYGAPDKVMVNTYSLELIDKIDQDIKLLCPHFNVTFLKSCDNCMNSIVLTVVNKLYQWMEKANSGQWEIGCCIIQREINTEVKPGQLTTPQALFFKNINENHQSNDDVDSKAHELYEYENDPMNSNPEVSNDNKDNIVPIEIETLDGISNAN